MGNKYVVILEEQQEPVIQIQIVQIFLYVNLNENVFSFANVSQYQRLGFE